MTRHAKQPPDAQRALSIDAIRDAALAIVAEDGVQALSMRELARRLEVWPNAVLHHVPTKDALLGLVVDAVLAEVGLPPADLPWKERIRRYSVDFRGRVLPYAGLASVLLTRPGLTPRVQKINRDTVAILLEAGFSDAQAARAFASVYTYILGTLSLMTRSRDLADGPLGRADEVGADDENGGLADRIGRVIREADPEEQFVFGLDMLMNGLEAERAERRSTT